MATDTPAPSHPDAQRTRPVYITYLNIDELLELQKPPEQRLHPDELTFQVVHQTFELWWKATTDYLERAIALLDQDNALEAARMLRRAVAAQAVVMQAMRQLEFIAPADFLTMRAGLGNGSGADSPGFRAILRIAPRLWEAFTGAVQRANTTLLGLYADPAAHPALYDCAEALTDFDEVFHVFRAQHLKLAQRHLGLSAIGTGGTPMNMLERTLRDLLFPQLWEARDELLASRQAADGASSAYSTGHGSEPPRSS